MLNLKERNVLLESVAQGESGMLHRVIGNTFIVEYGIIKAVPSDGVVTVEMSVAEDTDSIIITNCVLANIAAKSFALNVKPNKDDKVLVLFPRKYHQDMFNVKKNETIIYEQGTGYNVLTGIAILLNQFQDLAHNNSIDISDGVVTGKLSFSQTENKNLINFSTTADGDIKFDNPKAEYSLDKDGALTVNLSKADDDNKTTISVDKDSNIILTTPKAEYSLDKNGALTLSLAKDDNGAKAELAIDKDGALTVSLAKDSSGAKADITSDKDGTITLKNKKASVILSGASGSEGDIEIKTGEQKPACSFKASDGSIKITDGAAMAKSIEITSSEMKITGGATQKITFGTSGIEINAGAKITVGVASVDVS